MREIVNSIFEIKGFFSLFLWHLLLVNQCYGKICWRILNSIFVIRGFCSGFFYGICFWSINIIVNYVGGDCEFYFCNEIMYYYMEWKRGMSVWSLLVCFIYSSNHDCNLSLHAFILKGRTLELVITYIIPWIKDAHYKFSIFSVLVTYQLFCEQSRWDLFPSKTRLI